MSKIDSELVRKLALLARLELSDEETKSLTGDLESIFLYIETLNRLDVSDIEPLSHVHDSNNVFREDSVATAEERDAILVLAPDRSGAFIRVPLVIDHESS